VANRLASKAIITQCINAAEFINAPPNKETHKVMTRLCHVNDIDEGASKGFEINDKKLFAVKKDAVIYVYENRCPHLGIELEWLEDQFLDSEGALIQCSTHGALFLIEDGNCISGPCAGQQLRPIDTVIQADEVFLSSDTAAN
tara:strand:- start:357 stop:785 length:429 start_codon:yes stop_codon:yes gene_type:complete